LIRVQPIIPKILFTTEQNGPMPMFDSFLAAQAATIQSRRLIGQAMSDPEFQALGRGSDTTAEATFAENLAVTIPRGSPMIQITVTDADRNAAATAVKTLIKAYLANYEVEEGASGNQPINQLSSVKTALQAQLDVKKSEIRGVAGEYEPSALQSIYDSKLKEKTDLERQLRDTQMKLALLPPAPTTGPSSQPASTMSEAMIAQDAIIQQLTGERSKIEWQMKVDEITFGAHHRKMQEDQQRLKIFEDAIEARRKVLRSSPAQVVTTGASGSQEMSRPQLQVTQEILQKEIQQLEADTHLLSQKIRQIEDLRAEEQTIRERYEAADNREVALSTEKPNVSGRMSVISYGDLPVTPDKDRRKAMAAVGGLGLAGLGVGIVALLGFLDRRMHYIDAARSRLKSVDRMLGVLPELPEDLTDPEQASAAAYCVHRIRAMLQIRQRATGHKIFAITSPAPGDGKTSLTITLGMSMASCGCRTLLIDCDMDGGGLTSRFGHVVRRPLGQILLDSGAIGEAKLQDAIELAHKKGIKLGKALLELGHVPEQTIREALKQQRITAPGLIEVLKGENVERAIRTTGYPLLSVLPLGCSPSTQSGKLSPSAMRILLDRVADNYDLVLIDCGPILGSVEAAIVSAEADGVVLVVSRGGDRTAAEDAVNLLNTAGAMVEGIVFNRARHEDVAGSVYSSSSSARSLRSTPEPKSSSHGFGGVESAAAMHGARRSAHVPNADGANTADDES
jgi:Mrp family chromosome partitioning ATPase/uncharacterized protein involved in exopolysaccharide biosynthesis